MAKRLNSGSRAWNSVSGLLAFVLSAIMGLGLVTLVEKTHELLSSPAFDEQAVLGTWQGKWHGVPSVMVTINHNGDQLSGTVVFQAVREWSQAHGRFRNAAIEGGGV
jgi:hypothetical protein